MQASIVRHERLFLNMLFFRISQIFFVFKVERSLGNAENTNFVENKVSLQIDVAKNIIFSHISILRSM